MWCILQIPSASARNTTSYSGREVPVPHVSIPRSLPSDRTAQRHSLSPKKTVPSSVSNSEDRVLYSAAERGKTDQLVVKPSSLDDTHQANVTVTVSVPPNTDRQPVKSDGVDNSPEVRVHQSDENVAAETATKSDADALRHEYCLPADTVDSTDFCDDSRTEAGHVELASDVGHADIFIPNAGEAECVSFDPSEVQDSVLKGGVLLPAVGERADEVAVLTVSCEDSVVTEASLQPPATEYSATDSAIKLCSVTEEEVNGVERVEDMADESNCNDLVEAAVLSYIPEELTVCAAADENEPCLAAGEELLISYPTEQFEDATSSCFSDDNVLVMSPAADGEEHAESINGESLDALDSSHSAIDVFLPESLSFHSARSSSAGSDLTETYTTDVGISSAETDAQDEDVTVPGDRRAHVGFTIGESALTDGIFRRCSVDMAGRGSLSRIVEESAAGLAAVAGDDDQTHQQDGEQHIIASE